ncbi:MULTISPECIES: cupin domain-containing protein [Salinibaculum]|uniref:cupin domain-containing protein n=1 Tax=Salinibaculum TaxID=2732368 RepID=UPI0030D3C5DE
MVRHYDPEQIPAVYSVFDDIPERKVRKGVYQKMFRGLNMTMSWVRIEPDMETRPHSHPWEQVVFVVEGTADFHIDGEQISVEEGDVFFIPPNVEHYEEPNSDEPCILMDIWQMREGFLDLTDYQTEFDVDESI